MTHKYKISEIRQHAKPKSKDINPGSSEIQALPPNKLGPKYYEVETASFFQQTASFVSVIYTGLCYKFNLRFLSHILILMFML